MGSRGLKIVIFRGRYFVYYKREDGFLKGLGRIFVNSIPAELEQYKEWLDGQRAFYTELTEELERKLILVPDDGLYVQYENNNAWSAMQEVDGRLHELPTALCNVGTDLMIQWTYIIDLDNERFSVNNWIFFDLWNIPRDRLVQAFDQDGERKVFISELCPEGSVGTNPPEYFGIGDDVAAERDRYQTMYQQYSHSMVEAISGIDISSRAATQQLITILLFEKSTAPYNSHFFDYTLGWKHDSFAFRELAFAILSLAAGQYYFEDPNRLYGSHQTRGACGYLIDRNEGGEPKLMPLFGSGCHYLGREPGSAPLSSIYWFENVLISLVPDNAFEKDAEAAVAKAVEYGLKEGKIKFQVVLFSIFNAIMLEVNTKDGVKVIKRTEVVSICNKNRKTEHNNILENGVDICPGNTIPVKQVCRKQSGFISLQNFFSTATDRQISVFGNGRFPTEIYANIIAFADTPTQNVCAKVSLSIRTLCHERFALINHLTVLNFEAAVFPPGTLTPRRRFNLNDLGIFTLQDRNTKHIIRSGLDVRHQLHLADEKMVRAFCPVVGGLERPSMITQFQLRILVPRRGKEAMYEVSLRQRLATYLEGE